jgi:hypothetical protein
MRWVTTAAAVEAAATGMILLVSPTSFGRLVFATELSEPAQVLSRLTGIILLSFALASWPKPATKSTLAMFTCNLLTSLYLGYLAILGNLVGVLLWPAVALHLILSILLGRTWLAAEGS